MTKLRIAAAVLLLTTATFAQEAKREAAAQTNTTPSTSTTASAARAEDVKSIDAIVAALYDVISGPPGARDWNRFRSLFIPEGRLIVNSANPKGEVHYRLLTLDDYQQRAGEHFLKEGFFERGIRNETEEFGHVAHVFSTYESRHEKDAKPFARGINSIELLTDGSRWYVVSILWDQETPQNPIPQKYLP